MTYDEAGVKGSLSPLNTRSEPLRQAVLAPGTRILCCTDDPAYAERDILPVLRRAGVAAETINVATHAHFESLIHPYQAILFEINSETSVSFQVCQQIRGISGMPMMLILHGAAREEVLRAYHVGADACILAPFDPSEFLARLAGLLRPKPGPVA